MNRMKQTASLVMLASAILLLFAAGPVHAQLPTIPDMKLSSDGSSLTVHNPTGRDYLVVNIAVFWTDRNERWTQFPNDLIIKANDDTRLPYSGFVEDYDPARDKGTPSSVAFILLNPDNKYVALNFAYEEGKGLEPDAGKNAELTKLYQSMPVQKPAQKK